MRYGYNKNTIKTRDRKTLGNIDKAQGKDSSCPGLVLVFSVLVLGI